MILVGSQDYDDDVKNVALEILGLYRVCTLATTTNAIPWASSAYFANDALTLYLILEDGGRSIANISRNPNVALTIDSGIPDRFIQLGGVAEVLEGSEAESGREIVYAKLPECVSFFEMVPTSVVRVTPSIVYVSDMARGWFPPKIIEVFAGQSSSE